MGTLNRVFQGVPRPSRVLRERVVVPQFEFLGVRRIRCKTPTRKRTTAASPNIKQAKRSVAVNVLAHIKSPRKTPPSQLSTETPKQIFASLNAGIFTMNYSVPPSMSYSLFLVMPALAGLRHVTIGHHQDFLKAPNVGTQASGDAGRDSQRLVDSGEVVVYLPRGWGLLTSLTFHCF